MFVVCVIVAPQSDRALVTSHRFNHRTAAERFAEQVRDYFSDPQDISTFIIEDQP